MFALLDYMDAVAAQREGGEERGRSHPSTEIYSLAFATCFEKVRGVN